MKMDPPIKSEDDDFHAGWGTPSPHRELDSFSSDCSLVPIVPSPIFSFLVLSFLFSLSPSFADTIWYHERWRDAPDKQAYQQTYTGFRPLVYFMVPSDVVLSTRAYEDRFSLEDHSDYEDPNAAGPYVGVRTDITQEEYYEKLINNAPPPDGAPSGYLTYVERGPPNDQSGAIARTNLQMINFDPSGASSSPQDLFPSVSLWSVAGLIYRNEDFACSTNVAHPRYFTDSETGERLEVRKEDGSLEMIGGSSGDVCFFLYLPRVKTSDGLESGPFVGRVHVEAYVDVAAGMNEPAHQQSIDLISQGLAPYFPLSDDLKNQLTSGNYEIRYRHGRYLVPQKQGRIILPHNGANVLFNRRQTDRPYHHERHEVKVTSKKSSPIWIAVVAGLLTFGAGFVIAGAVTAAVVMTSIGVGVATALLLPNDESSRTLSGNSSGVKGEFADPWPTKITAYLALQQANDPAAQDYQTGAKPKFFSVIPVFNPEDGERALLTEGRGESLTVMDADGNAIGSREINFGYFDQVGAAIPAVNQEIPAGQWVSKVFPDPRWYQIMKTPGYNHAPPPASVGNPLSGGGGVPTAPCSASTDPAVQNLCTVYEPLMTDLDSYFQDHFGDENYLFAGNPGQSQQVESSWIAAGSSTLTVEGRSFQTSPEFLAFAEVYERNQTLIEQFETQAFSSMGGGLVLKPEYKAFAQTTAEGYVLVDRLSALTDSLDKVSKETLAKKWFEDDQDEMTTLSTAANSVVAGCQTQPPATRDACLTNGFGATPGGMLADYYALEDFPPVQRAFACYTASCYAGATPDGPKVLGILTQLEDLIEPMGPRPYQPHLDSSESCPKAPTNPTLSDRADCVKDEMVKIISGGPPPPKTPVNPQRRWVGE